MVEDDHEGENELNYHEDNNYDLIMILMMIIIRLPLGSTISKS